MRKFPAVGFVIVIVVFGAGCVDGLDRPDEVQKPPVELDPLPKPQTGTFTYSGIVGLFGIGEGCVENVRVSLYDSNADRIKSKQVGTLCFNNKSPQTKNFTISSTVQPIYIVTESPDFWTDDPVAAPVGAVRKPNNTFYDGYPIQEQGQIKPRGEYASTIAGDEIPSERSNRYLAPWMPVIIGVAWTILPRES